MGGGLLREVVVRRDSTVFLFSKIQLEVYFQCCVLIG